MEISQENIEYLKTFARRESHTDHLDKNDCLDDMFSGNMDDAYQGGVDDGEIELARQVLDMIGIKYE